MYVSTNTVLCNCCLCTYVTVWCQPFMYLYSLPPSLPPSLPSSLPPSLPPSPSLSLSWYGHCMFSCTVQQKGECCYVLNGDTLGMYTSTQSQLIRSQDFNFRTRHEPLSSISIVCACYATLNIRTSQGWLLPPRVHEARVQE